MRAEVIHGDCLDVLRGLPDASVDMVIADPPYSGGTRKENDRGLRKSRLRSMDDSEWISTDSLTANGFVWLMHAVAVQWQRVLVPGGHAFCFIDWRMVAPLSGAIESADLRYTDLVVWDKTYFGMGHYFRRQHELVLHFSKGRGADFLRHDLGDVLTCKPIRGGVHPTEKPIELLSKFITAASPVGGVVLDPFCGSGSTGVSAIREGRSFIGIERETVYVEMARRRVAEASEQITMEVA